MARTYDRELITWDLASLRALAALDPPQAVYFEKADRWVVKMNGRSYAVKPEQIVLDEKDVQELDDNAAEAALADDEQAAEQCHRERFGGGQSSLDAKLAEFDELADFFTRKEV